MRVVLRMVLRVLVVVILACPALQQSTNSTQPPLTCETAIDAAFWAAQALAAARNVSGLALTAQSRNLTSPSAQFVAVLQKSLQDFVTVMASFASNTVNMFTTPPYAGWGNRMAQVGSGQVEGC